MEIIGLQEGPGTCQSDVRVRVRVRVCACACACMPVRVCQCVYANACMPMRVCVPVHSGVPVCLCARCPSKHRSKLTNFVDLLDGVDLQEAGLPESLVCGEEQRLCVEGEHAGAHRRGRRQRDPLRARFHVPDGACVVGRARQAEVRAIRHIDIPHRSCPHVQEAGGGKCACE
jgi:hypothetical protein